MIIKIIVGACAVAVIVAWFVWASRYDKIPREDKDDNFFEGFE